MPAIDAISSVVPAGIASTAARSSALLNERSRRLPERPRIFAMPPRLGDGPSSPQRPSQLLWHNENGVGSIFPSPFSLLESYLMRLSKRLSLLAATAILATAVQAAAAPMLGFPDAGAA